MKLKPIIASMMLLGLSAPAFADDTQSQLDSMKAQIAKMETIIGQNQNASINQPQDWFNRITVSGLVNVDAFAGSRNPNFKTYVNAGNNVGGTVANSQNLALDNANLMVHAMVNEWVTGDIDFVYQDNNNNFIARAANSNALDEGYVTIGNFAKNPFYFRAGRLYTPFGQYERYPLLTNPTQTLSETSATAAQFGLVLPQGFYASVYAFRGLPQATNGVAQVNGNALGGFAGAGTNGVQINRNRIQNYGADVGYMYASDTFGTKLDVGFMNNMANVNYIAGGLNSYTSTVPAVSVSADFRYSAFDASLRWVGATGEFNFSDVVVNTQNGAMPRAYGVEAGYTFPVMAHSSRLAAGYQHTKDALNVGFNNNIASPTGQGLPLDRVYADYMVNISKWTDLGFAVYRDRDYSTGNLNGTGNQSVVGMMRLSVKVA